jgi:hypothetical protein
MEIPSKSKQKSVALYPVIWKPMINAFYSIGTGQNMLVSPMVHDDHETTIKENHITNH